MLTLETQLSILRHNPDAWHRKHRFGHETSVRKLDSKTESVENDTPAFVWDDELKTYVRS
jgi:hypothetical protein